MLFDIHTFPQHRVVYCVYEQGTVVYFGEGGPERLGTTLADPVYHVLAFDTNGGHAGNAGVRFVEADGRLANLLPVPTAMQLGQPRQTLFSTNVENILIALFVWQTGALPRDNGIQNHGGNKGGWIADCQATLDRFFLLYEQMGCPVLRPWPRGLSALPQVNPEKTGQFLTVWSSVNAPVTLNIGFCNVAGNNVPHMSNAMNPTVVYPIP